MSDLSKLETLSAEEKRALLRELLSQTPGITRGPLSYGQRALWLVYRLDPRSSAYNVVSRWGFDAAVDRTALQRAVDMLVSRHAVLHSTFDADEPIQVADPRRRVLVEQHDVADREEALVALMEEAANAPFQLDREAAFRVHLFSLAPERHVLQLTFHHIVYDLRSGMQLMSELPALFEAAVAGRPSPLPPVADGYAGYVRWQQDFVASAEGEWHWAYWRHQLNALAPVDLPTDSPRPAFQTYQGATTNFRLPPSLAAAVRSLARHEGTTPYVVLLAGFVALLHRHARQRDIVVGSPGWGRTRPEFDSIVGYFVNPLVVRVAVEARMPFTALVQTVRERVIEGIEHGEFPFGLLVERLQPARDPSRSPLFQIAFTWNNVGLLAGAAATPSSPDHAGRTLVPRFLGGGQQGANFDLELAIAESGDELSGWWRYNVDLFRETTVCRFADQYLRLMEHALEAPETPVIDLSLTAASRCTPIAQQSAVAAPGGEPRSLITAFEEQVRRTPGAPALTCDRQTVTFESLNQRANQLAHCLRAHGAGPESIVALCLDRSIELVIAALAILKAGAAYLPIDPAAPVERIRFMAADAGVDVCVTDRTRADLFPSTIDLLRVDADAVAIASFPVINPAIASDPDALAYVIYTSGSTGQPKGVDVTHHNVLRLFESTAQWFHFGPDDVWCLFHSMAFDFSVWELWGALLYGGRLVVVPYFVSRSPKDFLGMLIDERVTVLNQTPSAFRQLIAASDENSAALTLRYVIFGGEALDLNVLRPWIERHGDDRPQLINMYGITETTVHVTYRRVTSADVAGGRRNSLIGVPIPDLTLHLLDERGTPVPDGMRGEIHVGGLGIARGYHGQARRTAERFVPDPFGAPGARLYRSGDIARRIFDGDLEYHGRADHQVKIRGFRIELGEIEAALRCHPGVDDAVVIAQSDQDDGARLVGYVVANSKTAGPAQRLAAWQRSGRLGARRWHELPNGLPVVHLNRNETEFLYSEIFGATRYLRHGVSLQPGACIVDVGANIGLFTVYAGYTAPGATIFAFEPIPHVFELLQLNAELHGLDVRAYACGLADSEGDATFTYYPNLSILSGRFGDAEQERLVIEAFLRNQSAREDPAPALLDELLAERLTSQSVQATLMTLSHAIARDGIDRIDLLKIDVEKSELSVLNGIEPADWPKIQQVIIEVHDDDGRLAAIMALLEARGFRAVSDQDESLAATGLYSVYAVREARPAVMVREPDFPQWATPDRLIGSLREGLTAVLPDYMVPSAFVLLDEFPLTANGKLDTQALPAFQPARRAVTAPRSELEEQIAAIWRDVLQVTDVGVEDNFFELGGHSLLATKVISRLRESLAVDVPLRRVFEAPTLESLALAVIEQQAGGDLETLREALAEIEGVRDRR